ncbi:MAG: DUF1207 domain-containing protein [Waddliaceae bacterium]|nr:DUF1207 domain-containing protein [Waddliaceae bacterium]MBT3579565.1 DUF1207 domain-containing protein [Waddliaceae bacterium]MBT6928172.1 DUF1207 domain-containing protein [Waddliaceae bacterium]MBT7263948.1 DUF1207 domain-containing protein [Waddliaceae bacterium]
MKKNIVVLLFCAVMVCVGGSIFGADDVKAEASQRGEWLPSGSELFKPPIADPRIVSYSAGYRVSDSVISHYVAAVSFGEPIPLYRFNEVSIGEFAGALQIDLEPGIWSVFDTNRRSLPLINTDFSIGVVATYAFDMWSFRARLSHVSTHLGDEYVINESITDTQRLNVSNETFDVMASYKVSDDLRFFAGLGYILNSNKEFTIQPLFIEYGGEAYFCEYTDAKRKLVHKPFFALYIKNKEDVRFSPDINYCVGVETDKTDSTGKRLRVMAEYHDGYSQEGQFMRDKTQYFTLKFSFGY